MQHDGANVGQIISTVIYLVDVVLLHAVIPRMQWKIVIQSKEGCKGGCNAANYFFGSSK